MAKSRKPQTVVRKSKKNRDWLSKQFLEALRPSPLLSVSEYAEKFHMLPSSAAEPGHYKLSRTPYAKEILDCMGPDSTARKVVAWTGTQISKTEIILCTIDYYVTSIPCAMLLVSSNDTEAKNMVKLRIDPMIEASPQLKERISGVSGKRSGDTVGLKEFPGGFLALGSGEAPASLRSKPCRIAFVDEYDSMPDNCKGEGDPLDLVTRRTSTFSGREKVYVSSTCINGNSKIIREYNQTDKRKLFVPCPSCGHMQLIEWSRIRYKNNGTHVTDVWMECEHCKFPIRNHHKTKMLANGRWIATNPKPTDPTAVGFWMSGLYSPVGWQSWEQCVSIYLKAVDSGDPNMITSFYNTVLAEQYTEGAARPDYEILFERAQNSDYDTTTIEDCIPNQNIPNDVLVLTSGADVQDDRIECEVVGWGRNGRSKSVNYFVFYCDKDTFTSDPNNPVWERYRDVVINGTYIRQDGRRLVTQANAMDRGYNSHSVNALWYRTNSPRFFIVRGNGIQVSELSMEKQDKGGNSKRNNEWHGSKFRFYDVGVSTIKATVYERLMIRQHIRDGKTDTNTPFYCMFPANYPEHYFKMLTAEEFINDGKRGKWIKKQDRNEALDCRVYATAMWYKLEMYRLEPHQYDELERAVLSQDPLQKGRTASKQRTARLVSKGIRL